MELSKGYHGESCENYYQSLLELDSKEIGEKQKVDHSKREYLRVGAGTDKRFENTEELKSMKYKEAINGPDGEARKEEIMNE